ncbi:MAG: O-antigen ligase family protein [Candidatus Acetothermia bacterium]|nr:O-antigen ligase family protein [Candidatus Acetothermia bacterium]
MGKSARRDRGKKGQGRSQAKARAKARPGTEVRAQPRSKGRARRKAGLKLADIARAVSTAIPSVRRAVTAFLIFTLPLLIYLGNTEYGYTKSIFALFVISFLLVLWALEMVLRRAYRLNLTPLFLPGLALLAAGALSTVNATSLGTALQSLGQLFYFFAFYMFLANTVEREWEMNLYLSVILGSAVLASAYGALQYYGVLPGTPGVPKGSGAIISTMGNKNFLGGFLACLVLPSLMLTLRLRRWPLRALGLLALAIIVYALKLVDSDGAWLAVGLSGGFFLGGLFYFRIYRAFRFGRGWPIIGAALFAVLLMSLPATFSSPASDPALALRQPSFDGNLPLPWRERTESPSSPPSPIEGEGGSWTGSLAIPVIDQLIKLWEKNSGRIRAWDWWVGWEMLKAHPILGVGIGHYKVQFLPYKAKFLATPQGKRYTFYIQRAAQAHNEYVQVAAEMGSLGILAGGFALMMLFWSGLRLIGRAEARDKLSALGLLAGVVASLADALVSFPFHLPASALAFVLLLGLLNSRWLLEGAHVRTWPCGRRTSLSPRTSWAILAAVLVLGLSVTTLAYRDWVADTLLDRGEQALKRGQIEEAREQLEKSLQLDFAPASSLYWLGSIYHKLGDEQADPALLEQSLRLLERSLSSFPVESTYFQLAQLYLNLGQFEKAREHVHRLLATAPRPDQVLDARYLEAVITWQEGDPDGALSQLKELLAQQRDYERAYIIRARIYLDRGNAALARLDLEEAHKIVVRKRDSNWSTLTRLKEQGLLTPEKYAELTNEIARLDGEKSSIEKLLQELPK